MDLSLTYRALAEKQVDLIAGNSTDGLICRYRLDAIGRRSPLFSALRCACRWCAKIHWRSIRRSGDVLKQLGGILTVDEMRKLNYAVDGEKRQPREVAREFLKLKNIIR